MTKETEPADRHQLEERISFNRPSLVGNELAYVRDAIERGHISGDGRYTRRCEEILSLLMGGARVLLTTSCTHALEMTALLLDIRPGDEVILPSFTFVSAANAFVLRGARPVFIDSRPDTLNMDERLLAPMITERTRAVVAMHYGGVGCEMDTIMAVARNAGVKVIEDNAHGLFGGYRGRPLGTFGDMSTLSFHETKNIFCGEGGSLVLNEPSLAARAEILREKGTDRSRFFRGEVDRYTWVDLGSSYVPSEMLAAFLLGQLEKRDDVQAARQRIWQRYHAGLTDWAENRGIQLPGVPPHCASSHHLFYLLMPRLDERQALITHLRHRGIQGIFHYIPLHTSAMGQQFGGRPGDCPVAESVSDRIVRLPFFSSLTEEQQMRVIDAVRSF